MAITTFQSTYCTPRLSSITFIRVHITYVSIQIFFLFESRLTVSAHMTPVNFECMGTCDVMIQLIKTRKASFPTDWTRNYLIPLMRFDVSFQRGNVVDVSVARKTAKLRLQTPDDSTTSCMFVQVVDTVKGHCTTQTFQSQLK